MNDAPKILAAEWSVAAGSLLSVRLDSTRSGKAVWVDDPDDSYLNLTWTAKLSVGAPMGAVVTVTDRKLIFQAPAGFSGPVVVEVTVKDLAGAQTTKEVIIKVVPPQVEIYGIKTEQLVSGDLKATFFSRYSLEAVALQNGVIKVLNPATGAWGTVPARLAVVQAPSFRDGRWTDGQYELVVGRSSTWTLDRTSMSLVSLARGSTSLSVKLPLAADGKALEKDAQFTGLDLNGPIAMVSAIVVPNRLGEPDVHVDWKWLEPGTPQFIRLSLTSGDDRHERIVPVPTGATSVDIPWIEPQWDTYPVDPKAPYIRDGQDYLVELVGADDKANQGGGSVTLSVPSSKFELRITTVNLLQIPRPSGQVCISGTRGFRGCSDFNSYGAGQLTTGRIMDVPRDLYKVTVEDPRYQPIILDVMPGSHRLGPVLFEHSPNYPVSRQNVDTAPDMKISLLRRNFLAQDGASVEQELGTGDLVFKFERNQFPGGILDTVLFGVSMMVDGSLRNVDVRIPVTEYDESNTPGDLDSWTVRRSLADLKNGSGAALFAKASDHSVRYLGAVARFANSWTPERIAKIRDSVVYHVDSRPVAWHVLDPDGPAIVEGGRRTINNDGGAIWNLSVPATHGARATLTTCRRNDNAPETCNDREVNPESAKLAFRLTTPGAFSVPGYVNFEEPLSGGGVRVPLGKSAAASQWDVFTTQTTNYDVWIYWSTDHLADDFSVSKDQGATWSIQTTLLREGWNQLGSMELLRGWNAISLRASQGPNIHALLVQKAGSPAPSMDIATLPFSHAPVASRVTNNLQLDQFYKATITVRDAFGLNSKSISGFPVQPDGLFGDLILEQAQASGDLILRAGQTQLTPGSGGVQIRLAPRTPAIVPDVDNSDHLVIRIPRNRIPPEFFSTPGLSKNGPLDSIQILTTKSTTYSWTTRECWDDGLLGGWGCETIWNSYTDTKPDSIQLRWTGFGEWKSGHDLRPLPKPAVSVVYAGLDSIQLKVSGLDDSSSQTRQTMSGRLSVEWTPGSHCASSSTVDVAFQQVFVADNSGTILFRPRLSSAKATGFGGWTDTSSGAPRLRHQWLDHSEGGGFFPLMVLPTPLASQKRAWVSFTVRNPTLTPAQVKLWTVPGPYAGQTRQAFEFRLAPVGTSGGLTPPGVIWHSGTGFAQGWHQQADELVLQPGDQELQIRMMDPGVTFRALGLRPSAITTDPAEAIASLPYVGTQGMNEILVSAPSLASGTLHGFRITATDRMGNTSSDTITVATQSSAAKFPTVGIALAPWDGSGWITGNVATASFVPDGRFTLPENAEIKAWLRHRSGTNGALTNDSTEVPVVKNQDGTYTATLTGLGAFGQTLQDFQIGDRTVLVAYVQSGSLRGNRSGIDFAILSETHPGAMTATFLDGPPNKGLTFHVRQAWQQQSGTNSITYADLELPAFRVQEDDTATNRLLLRGALVSFTQEASGLRLNNVIGGRLAAVHCKLTGTVESGCHDVARMPWTLGRWAGFLETESMTTDLTSSSWSLLIQQAELIDDAGRPSRNSAAFSLSDAGVTGGGGTQYLGLANFSKDRFWFRNVVASGDEEAFGIEACQTEIRRTASGLEFKTMGCEPNVGPFLTFPLHIQTDGPWSVVGAAFDSLDTAYHLNWTPDANPGSKWVSGSPLSRGTLQVPATNVNLTKSSLHNVSGASLWGYDVKSYSFGRSGVSNLVFDLVFPDSKLTPAQAGVSQRVKSFTGMSIVSSATIMKGSPVLQGTGISTNLVQLNLGSSLRLDDVVMWTYARKDGIGWVLTPLAATNKTLVLSKAQDANWKYTKIGTITQADDRFRFPFTSLELGAGSYVAASSSQDVKISTGGATIQAKLNIDPNDDELRIQAATPKVILDKFFTEKGGLDFKPVTVPDPELTLDPEFELADIEGVGSLGTPAQTAQYEVWVGGLPVVNAIPSGRYQIMANRGRLFVRLYRPQMALNDFGTGGLPGAPSAEVQTAVFSTDRMPVAVGAELDVPASWRDWQIPGSIGSLQLDKVYLEATAQRDPDQRNFLPGDSPFLPYCGQAGSCL
ncbi:MAG: hypothetical protein IPN71_21610 [Fibrobacteres bacterium]|nr:hypothetical protein [Fibrobacterota bacterium]